MRFRTTPRSQAGALSLSSLFSMSDSVSLTAAAVSLIPAISLHLEDAREN